MTTQITIQPTVKNQIQNSFGIDPLLLLMIETYYFSVKQKYILTEEQNQTVNNIYNKAFAINKSAKNNNKIAQNCLVELTEIIKSF